MTGISRVALGIIMANADDAVLTTEQRLSPQPSSLLTGKSAYVLLRFRISVLTETK